MVVGVAIGDATAIDNHAVVQKAAVAVFGGLHLLDETGELLHVILVDLPHFLHQVGLVAVVGQRVMTILIAGSSQRCPA